MLNMITTDKTSTKDETPQAKTVLSMILDSFIIAIIAVFSLWSGEVINLNEFLPLLKAFVLSLVIQFAYYRGIKKQE